MLCVLNVCGQLFQVCFSNYSGTVVRDHTCFCFPLCRIVEHIAYNYSELSKYLLNQQRNEDMALQFLSISIYHEYFSVGASKYHENVNKLEDAQKK